MVNVSEPTLSEDCPTGDDPMTPGENEVQMFQCNSLSPPSGGFYLQYKRLTTPFIPVTAVQSDVDAALRTLFSMNDFQLTFLGSGPEVCSPATVVRIEFLQEFGT